MLNKNYTKKNLKTWQFWMPSIPVLTYELFYIPKNIRSELNKSSYVIKMTYTKKDSHFYVVPKMIIPGTVNNSELILKISTSAGMYKLKPFLIGLIISVLGLTFRFKIFIRVKGLGYKAYVLNNGNTLNLKLGYSHIVKFNFFDGMFATKLGQKDRMFSIEGPNWIVLTNTLYRITNLKKIDYYRGKGIFKKFFICKIRISKKKKK